MNLIILVWSYLKARPLTTVLNVILLAVGVSVITVLVLFSNQLQERITSNSRGIDLVVGAKGSPLQVILCSVFHIDFPTGNIRLSDAERIAKHRLVKKAIPLALGDSYLGFRIVGTNTDYPEFYKAELSVGNWWSSNMEVTVGATVAEQLKLSPGAKFLSAHGLTSEGHAHEEHPYLVAGIMKRSNTVLDNLILTNIQSIWLAHDLEESGGPPVNPSSLVSRHEAGDSTREVTSLLIQYRNPLAVIQLPRYINSQTNLQAAAPAFEMARLFSILGVGADVFRGFAVVLILMSGLSIFIVLYNSMKERRYDLAIMRSMGVSRVRLFLSVIMEGSMLTTLGSAIGILLGHGALLVFAIAVKESAASGMQAAVFYPEEAWLFIGSLGLGIFCSILPALQAYRTDIHSVLAGN